MALVVSDLAATVFGSKSQTLNTWFSAPEQLSISDHSLFRPRILLIMHAEPVCKLKMSQPNRSSSMYIETVVILRHSSPLFPGRFGVIGQEYGNKSQKVVF